MICSKIGVECSHKIGYDEKLVFVLMPFKEFDSVYDSIKIAVDNTGLGLKCERADSFYTSFDIWCTRICQNIRRAKYLIVDTTNKNANVFYEFGFAHGVEKINTIILTQNIEDAPFDIKGMNHITYSANDSPVMKEKIKKAILSLEKEESGISYKNKTTQEVIEDLNSQLRDEEKRAANFKKDLVETEKREKVLKTQIRELYSIQDNPAKEAENKIIELEGSITNLKSKLRFAAKDKIDTISDLKKAIQVKEKKLQSLEEKFKMYE